MANYCTAAFSISGHGRLRKSFLGPLGRRPRRPRGPPPPPLAVRILLLRILADLA